MKKSIFLKLLVFMITNIIIFTLLLTLANLIFANDYYINRKKNLLIENAEEINQVLKDVDVPFNDNLHLKLDQLSSSIGGSITVGSLDPNGKIYYPDRRSLMLRSQSLGIRPFFQVLVKDNKLQLSLGSPQSKNNVLIKEWDQYDENSFMVRVEDPSLLIDTLRYQTLLDNDMIVQIWIPMTELNENINVANRFTAIVALITLFVTGLSSIILSKQFTKPITRMNAITKQMSSLDFSESLVINGEDELAELSININQLSKKLNLTLDELQSKNLQLEKDIHKERQLDAMRKDFISSVSHELKTPIFLIQGYAEGLKANVADSPEKKDFYSDVIIEEADKMNLMVRDLLDLSQLESGKFSITKIEFDLGLLTQDIVKKLAPIVEENHISITTHFQSNLMTHADPIRVEQVIYNLLTNAIHHCEGDKKIELSIQMTPKNNSNISTLTLSVFNTGSPIPEETMDKLWTSFYKVDDARTRDYGGSGLGLSIVKNIIKAHEHTYGVRNLDDGVEFWFQLDHLVHHKKKS